jgi:hypothetical protein
MAQRTAACRDPAPRTIAFPKTAGSPSVLASNTLSSRPSAWSGASDLGAAGSASEKVQPHAGSRLWCTIGVRSSWRPKRSWQ